MKKWLSGVRGSILMVLLWVIGWGVGFGGLIETFVDPHGGIIDIWPAALAIPGFLGGAMISALLRMAEGRRRVDEVPLAHFTAWGVVTGVVLGVLAVAIGLTNDIAIDTAEVMPVAPAAMIGVTSALGVVAAVGSAVFFRLLARGQTPAAAGPQA